MPLKLSAKLMDCFFLVLFKVLASFFWFAIELINVDFPEFERPQRAISLPLSSGKSFLSVAAQQNSKGKGFDL